MIGVPEGTGRVWFSGVQCTGNENHILECGLNSVGVNLCTHLEDAGVRCSPGKNS